MALFDPQKLATSTKKYKYDHLNFGGGSGMYTADFSAGCYTIHWRIQGGRQGRAPPGGPNSFIFMQFSAKN